MSYEARAARDIVWHSTTPSPLACYDCGLRYGADGWCDAVVPDDVWAKIAPTPHGGGVLCLTCMARRVVFLGLDNVPLKITSGPWSDECAGCRIMAERALKAEELLAAASDSSPPAPPTAGGRGP